MKKILTLTALVMASPIFAADKTIVRGTDHFELVYELTVPKLAGKGTLWIPLARNDAFQTIQTRAITSPVPWRKTRDASGENEVLVLQPTPTDSGKRIRMANSTLLMGQSREEVEVAHPGDVVGASSR